MATKLYIGRRYAPTNIDNVHNYSKDENSMIIHKQIQEMTRT
jgi:hypothetical protein